MNRSTDRPRTTAPSLSRVLTPSLVRKLLAIYLTAEVWRWRIAPPDDIAALLDTEHCPRLNSDLSAPGQSCLVLGVVRVAGQAKSI
jgi:hypothetical protein